MVAFVASKYCHFFNNTTKTSSYDPEAIGLCFSGGGYRATLFHAGAILRLNELGVLGAASRIASVSGGSIATGILAMAWNKLAFDMNRVATAESMRKHFVHPILSATAKSVDAAVTLKGLLPGVSAGNALAEAYDRQIFKRMKLCDTPKVPQFIWCSTNLQTGGLFRFQRTYLADWRALRSTTENILLSQAVAASSAFPPLLSPLRLDLSEEKVTRPEGARFDDPNLRRRPVLVDGGVYDNLGLEPIWKRCGVIFSSNAGQNSPARPSSLGLDHMVPVVYSFLDSSIDWRERVLVQLLRVKLADGLPERAGAYWTIATPTNKFGTWGEGWAPEPNILQVAASQPTRLRAFSRDDQVAAIYSGYAYADAATRNYARNGMAPPSRAPEIP